MATSPKIDEYFNESKFFKNDNGIVNTVDTNNQNSE